MTFNPERDVNIAKSEYLEKVNRIHRGVFFEVARRIIMRTPVDTGRARGNWLPGVGDFKTGFNNESLDPSGQGALAAVQAALGTHRPGQDLTLANNLVYILPLENGHSKQAPAGMVELTVAEFDGIVATEVAFTK